jgi:acyl-CoA synthetase (AMP-forming)/AMP-acid ligase II
VNASRDFSSSVRASQRRSRAADDAEQPAVHHRYYGILRANAVVVPVNPMNLTPRCQALCAGCGASTIIVSQELYPRRAAAGR